MQGAEPVSRPGAAELSKINDILEAILTLDGDEVCEAKVYVAVMIDTGEILGAGLTEKSAMQCGMAAINVEATVEQERQNEENAETLVSLVKVPLW